MKTMFQLNHVTKRFGGMVALDDVSLDGPPGTVVALLGENGAGKTTSLKSLLGLCDPDSGDAEVLGLSSRRQGREIRRRVGYVPERPQMYGWMTVGEVGWFAAGFHGPDTYAQFCKLVQRFELSPKQKLKTLSKGQLGKVSLAVSMAHEPELLILDEPTSGLDPIVRRDFLSSMSDVAAEGRTVLLSSHQIHEVERVADIVAILRKGKLVVSERLDDLKQAVREITLTLPADAPLPTNLPGTLISQQRIGQQWRALVRDLEEGDLLSLQARADFARVDVRAPSLEEIFVGYLHPDKVPGAGGTWTPAEENHDHDLGEPEGISPQTSFGT